MASVRSLSTLVSVARSDTRLADSLARTSVTAWVSTSVLRVSKRGTEAVSKRSSAGPCTGFFSSTIYCPAGQVRPRCAAVALQEHDSEGEQAPCEVPPRAHRPARRVPRLRVPRAGRLAAGCFPEFSLRRLFFSCVTSFPVLSGPVFVQGFGQDGARAMQQDANMHRCAAGHRGDFRGLQILAVSQPEQLIIGCR